MCNFQNKQLCMSEYLMYRYLYDDNVQFGIPHHNVDLNFPRVAVSNSDELLAALQDKINESTRTGKAALALSGGMDSAILARLMPNGATAYTFRCVVPGKMTIDESINASVYAKENHLNHIIIDIYWDDILNVVDKLMRHKGAPIHSIETQIYIAAKRAISDGFQGLIFGENADIIYGGMDGLISKEWLFGEFVDRYTYVMPYKVVKDAVLPMKPFNEFENDGHIDGHEFINKYFRQEALGTYRNACDTAGIKFIGPYSETKCANKLDYNRIRNGETKYIIRDLYKKLYPAMRVPDKIPMPRPVDEWFEDWDGPGRKEFIPHSTDNMTGNQKWMVWCLERYLNLFDNYNIR